MPLLILTAYGYCFRPPPAHCQLIIACAPTLFTASRRTASRAFLPYPQPKPSPPRLNLRTTTTTSHSIRPHPYTPIQCTSQSPRGKTLVVLSRSFPATLYAFHAHRLRVKPFSSQSSVKRALPLTRVAEGYRCSAGQPERLSLTH